MDEKPVSLTQYCAPGTTSFQADVELSTGVSLRYYRFLPANPANNPLVVFVPGLVSVMDNFTNLLRRLTRTFEVIYLETAEKKTSKTPPSYIFSVQSFSADLAEFIKERG